MHDSQESGRLASEQLAGLDNVPIDLSLQLVDAGETVLFAELRHEGDLESDAVELVLAVEQVYLDQVTVGLGVERLVRLSRKFVLVPPQNGSAFTFGAQAAPLWQQ